MKLTYYVLALGEECLEILSYWQAHTFLIYVQMNVNLLRLKFVQQRQRRPDFQLLNASHLLYRIQMLMQWPDAEWYLGGAYNIKRRNIIS